MSSQPSNTGKSGVLQGAESELQHGLALAEAKFQTELKAHVYVIIAIAAGLGGVIGALVGHAL